MADKDSDKNNQKNNITKLNVGGIQYAISKEIMRKSKILMNLIEEDFINENNEHFIDRDGFVFCHIVQYLRNEKLYVEETGCLEELKDEASFYQLEDLVGLINEKLINKKYGDKITYSLVDQLELEQLGCLNPDKNKYNLSRYTGTEECQLISTIKYQQKVYTCPRDIYSHHDKPYRCGRVCVNSLKNSGDDGWSRKDATMYLIAYKK